MSAGGRAARSAAGERAGAWLIAAAALFWLAWLLMPGVGITDAARILELVTGRRHAVLLSAGLQLLSAACYAPGLVAIAAHPALGPRADVRGAVAVLLVGAMGSAADAVFHLLAYAMTAPGLEQAPLVRVMAYMQGPGLLWIAPMIAAFFLGSVALSVVLTRQGVVSRWNPRLYALALVFAVAGRVLAAGDPRAARAVGLAVLALVAGAQAWLGLALVRGSRAGSGAR